jgi:hypothetical protein
LAQNIFLNLEFCRSEIDQEAMFNSRRFQITQDLGGMFFNQSPDGFQFDNESIVYEQIRRVFSNYGTVFVLDSERELLFYVTTHFFEPICQRVFIHFL